MHSRIQSVRMSTYFAACTYKKSLGDKQIYEDLLHYLKEVGHHDKETDLLSVFGVTLSFVLGDQYVPLLANCISKFPEIVTKVCSMINNTELFNMLQSLKASTTSNEVWKIPVEDESTADLIYLYITCQRNETAPEINCLVTIQSCDVENVLPEKIATNCMLVMTISQFLTCKPGTIQFTICKAVMQKRHEKVSSRFLPITRPAMPRDLMAAQVKVIIRTDEMLTRIIGIDFNGDAFQ